MKNRQLFQKLFILNFTLTLGFGMFDPFFSVYIVSLGIKASLLGIPAGIYALSKFFLSVPMGRLSDRFQLKYIAVSAVGLYCITAFGYMNTGNIATICLLKLVQGAAASILRPVILVYLNELSDKDRIASVNGTFDISFYGALGIGPFIGGLIREYAGFHGLISTMLVLYITSFIFVIKLPERYCKKLKDAEKKRSATITPTIAALMIFIFGRACNISAACIFIPLFAEKKLQLGSLQSGLIMGASTISMVFCLKLFGRMGDRSSRISLITAGGVVSSVFLAMIPLCGDFMQIFNLYAAIGVFSAMSQPSSVALLLNQSKKCGIGNSAGYFNLSLNSGMTAGPVIGAFILSGTDINTVFIAVGAIGMITSVVFMVLSSIQSSNFVVYFKKLVKYTSD
ncbi:MFS transporter [Seleniivibrio sp.]|uniref:MFS transporter n=1 Tax=Seleniivibrio sp. TaxID=2898801 RepID=UPI0025E27CC2|nr:MFS transporter [Seleniivibrio sp.]